MTEDELLLGICHALDLGGWRWRHERRSDHALVMGSAGWPDLICVRGGRLLVLELKAESGVVTSEQHAWIDELRAAGVDARIVRPADYDELLEELLGDKLARMRRGGLL